MKKPKAPRMTDSEIAKRLHNRKTFTVPNKSTRNRVYAAASYLGARVTADTDALGYIIRFVQQ